MTSVRGWPRIGPVVATLFQGLLPVLLVVDPVDHVRHADRDRVGEKPGASGVERHRNVLEAPALSKRTRTFSRVTVSLGRNMSAETQWLSQRS